MQSSSGAGCPVMSNRKLADSMDPSCAAVVVVAVVSTTLSAW
jgi:hypothetical protein